MKRLSSLFAFLALFSACTTPQRSADSGPTLTTEQLKVAAVDGQRVRLDGYLSYHDGAVSGTGKFYDLVAAQLTTIGGRKVLRCSATEGTSVFIPAEDLPLALTRTSGQHVLVSGRYHRTYMPVQWETARQDYSAYLTDVVVQQVQADRCQFIMVAPQ